MHDLVGAYERMNQVYQWYIESVFPLRYPTLNEERKKLLSQPGILTQPPLLETIPVYPTSGMNLQQASEKLPRGYQDLHYLIQAPPLLRVLLIKIQYQIFLMHLPLLELCQD